MRHYRGIIYSYAECAAWCLALKKTTAYHFPDFIQRIWEKFRVVEENIKELEKRLSAKNIKEWIGNIIYLSKHGDINELKNISLYEYDRILTTLLPKKKKKLSFSTLKVFFPQLVSAKVFSEILSIYFKEKSS
jgi:hypothetical protein